MALVTAALVLIIAGCANTGRAIGRAGTTAVSGLLTLDQALMEITAAVEEKVERGSEVGVARIDAPLPEIGDFLYDELLNSLGSGGRLVVLARGKDMETLETEHQLQMSGLVSDDSAVGIGHYLGAKVIITCSFNYYGNFSQLSMRALEVKTARILSVSRARIRNDDPILIGVTAPLLQNVQITALTEDALAHFNNGIDYYAERKYDDAIVEFNQAVAINRDFADAYCYRGLAYYNKRDYDLAIADYTATLRINPNYAFALINRGVAYDYKEDNDRAIVDFTSALRINSGDAQALSNRGIIYYKKGDYDLAIADFTDALRISPNYTAALSNRAAAYLEKGDIEKAVTDCNAVLRTRPNDAYALNNRGNAYYRQKDYEKAIADYEAALRINPNHPYAGGNLKRARNAQGR
jgi:lipoprotein NlpI